MRAHSRILVAVSLALPLGACSLFDDKDWREGVEEAAECEKRVGKKRKVKQLLAAAEGDVLPTFTFDITKMDLNAINEMIVPASGDERGSLRTSAFGATAPPVEAFMALDVTEAGAFYFGDDPSLYRVQGPSALPASEILAAGCAMQKADMRLTGFTLETAPSQPSDTE